jgi:signal transduction histidine kinase/CheY-like chemotaxis protein
MQGLLDPEFAYTFRIVRKDGRVVWIETRGASSIWNGKPATISFLSDISERKKIEEDMFRSEKLQSIGVLAGGIAHDFNNILTAVVANISFVRAGLERGSMQAERLAEAEKAAFRARDLTKQLLTFSRGGSPVRTTIAPAAIIRESAKLALLGRGTACDIRIADDLWRIEADEGQLGQVINNLVINASHAMAGGGTVGITAENREIKNGEQPPLAAGRYVTIAVTDRGTGIPEEHRSRIFDPYFTTKQEGSGLGLAVCYSIAKGHGGMITVDSEPGAGSSFTVFLPATDKPRVATRGPEPVMVRGSGRVLVMDDEEMVRNVAGTILTELGYEVGFARDGREAVAAFLQAKKDGRPFDVVIMDLTVPGGMGGKDAVRELLGHDPTAKVVVSSGYHQDPVMANYREHGFQDVIAKPYDASRLSKTLARVLTGR